MIGENLISGLSVHKLNMPVTFFYQQCTMIIFGMHMSWINCFSDDIFFDLQSWTLTLWPRLTPSGHVVLLNHNVMDHFEKWKIISVLRLLHIAFFNCMEVHCCIPWRHFVLDVSDASFNTFIWCEVTVAVNNLNKTNHCEKHYFSCTCTMYFSAISFGKCYSICLLSLSPSLSLPVPNCLPVCMSVYQHMTVGMK